ncbi:hypothetical protein AAAC51_46110 [Priestia megaterium]
METTTYTMIVGSLCLLVLTAFHQALSLCLTLHGQLGSYSLYGSIYKCIRLSVVE